VKTLAQVVGRIAAAHVTMLAACSGHHQDAVENTPPFETRKAALFDQPVEFD